MGTYRNVTDIAKDVRTQLKRELPVWKFSVRAERYSGGSSIYLSLMAGPEQIVEAHYNHVHDFPDFDAKPEDYQFKIAYTESKPFSGYAQLNHYQLLADDQTERGFHLSNGEYLTSRGWEILSKATKILAAYHWDESDSQTDYFHCAFYMHIEIGQWNKPYQVA